MMSGMLIMDEELVLWDPFPVTTAGFSALIYLLMVVTYCQGESTSMTLYVDILMLN